MRIRLAVALITVLIVVPGAARLSPAPVIGALASMPAAQRLVYHTNWHRSTLGWTSSGAGRWEVIANQLSIHESDITQASQIVAPYDPKQLGSYAVEAVMQYGGPGDPGNQVGDFGIVVRTKTGNDPSDSNSPLGIFAGAVAQGGSSQHQINPSVAIGYQGETDEINGSTWLSPIQRTDFDTGSGWHTYRVEVRANRYRVLVDGQQAVSVTSNAYFSFSQVGLFTFGTSVNVKSFRIYALR